MTVLLDIWQPKLSKYWQVYLGILDCSLRFLRCIACIALCLVGLVILCHFQNFQCFALLCHILLLRLWSAAFHGIHRSLRGGLRPFGHATAAVCAWHGSIALCDSSSSLRGGAWNGLDGWGRKRDGADGVDSGRRDGCISFKLLHMRLRWKHCEQSTILFEAQTLWDERNFRGKVCDKIIASFKTAVSCSEDCGDLWSCLLCRVFAHQTHPKTPKKHETLPTPLTSLRHFQTFAAEVCMWFATAIHESDHGTSKHWRLPVNAPWAKSASFHHRIFKSYQRHAMIIHDPFVPSLMSVLLSTLVVSICRFTVHWSILIANKFASHSPRLRKNTPLPTDTQVTF